MCKKILKLQIKNNKIDINWTGNANVKCQMANNLTGGKYLSSLSLKTVLSRLSKSLIFNPQGRVKTNLTKCSKS